MSTYRKIQSFVQQANPSWKKMLKQYQSEQTLLLLLQKQLNPELASHCLFVSQQNNTLYLYCDSPAIAAKLRLISPRILQQVNTQLRVQLENLVCKTVSSKQRITNNQQRTLKLPASAAEQMEGLANSLSDPQLSAALHRLSRRRSGNS